MDPRCQATRRLSVSPDLLSVLASVHEQTLTETRAMPDEVLDESVVFDDPNLTTIRSLT
ncbi:MAG: hypothetical protein Ct9H300mP1_07280 [Planctomycetaceae bacterium]|nr:MAG: hypothetical protein Ct9H300mP1_07280 [Planctomycetaceae bacterium]